MPPPSNILRPAAFLDRDGTLNVEVNYLHRAEDFVWIEGGVDAIRRLNEAGLLVVVVTNQAAVAHGICEETDVVALHAFMQAELKRHGAWIDAFYYCPYHPRGRVERYRLDSPMRKPGAGMFEQAVREWNVDAARSFLVGDKNSDIEPGRQLGMTTFLVETGYGADQKADTHADYVVPDVGAAAEQIVRLTRDRVDALACNSGEHPPRHL